MSSNRLPSNGTAPAKQNHSLCERERQADQQLASRYDALNMLLAQAEQQLKALKPIHAVWTQYGRESGDGQPDQWELLGITKHQGKWRLCHARDNELNNDSFLFDVEPIVECPVDVRVRAAKIVRELQERIVKSKEEYIPKVDEAIKELTDLCTEI